MKIKAAILGIVSLFQTVAFAQTAQQAAKYAELEQYESAKNVYRSLLKADPKNGEYYYNIGEIYLKTEKPDSAKYIFSEGLKNNENSPLNYVGMGKVVFETNPTEGKRSFDKALELSKSKDAKVLNGIADFYINSPKNKDIPQAILLLEKAIKLEPKNPQNYMLMGDAYLEKNDGSKAIAYYNQGFDLNKNWPYPYLKIGKLYTRAKNYSLGVDYYKKGLAIDENYAPLHRELGEVYFKAKQYKNAINSYKKYVDLSDRTFETDYRYAAFLFLNKDYKAAIDILARLDLDKKNLNNYFVNRLLGYSYYETGDYPMGLQNMDKFWKKVDPKIVLASDYEYYGKLYAKTGKDSLAIINFNEAIKRDTAQFALHGEMANMYMSTKKYKQAIDEYKIKMSQGEPSPTDYLNLGKAYYQDKNYKAADSAFTKLTEVAPTVPNGYIWRARALAAMQPTKHYSEPVPQYEKYISLVTDKEKNKRDLIEAYKYIGAYYMTIKKDKSKADPVWTSLKEIDPSFKEADEYLKAKY